MVYASAASDETQTNWNGLLGYFRLWAVEKNFISHVRIYRDEEEENGLNVCVEIDAETEAEGLRLESPALSGDG